MIDISSLIIFAYIHIDIINNLFGFFNSPSNCSTDLIHISYFYYIISYI